MSAKKTAFSDVKNVMGNTNTPCIPGKQSSLKKPVFGSQFKSKLQPNESKSAAPKVAVRKNYKPRIDLSGIDYSDPPHESCQKPGKRDFLYDFWSAAYSPSIDVYKDPEPVRAKTIELPDLDFLAPPTPVETVDHMANLFDDFPELSFSTASFRDL